MHWGNREEQQREAGAAILTLLVAGVASIAGAQGACPAKAAAWNVSQPGDIPDLEAKGFNLFFVEIATGPGPAGDLAMLPRRRRTAPTCRPCIQPAWPLQPAHSEPASLAEQELAARRGRCGGLPWRPDRDDSAWKPLCGAGAAHREANPRCMASSYV